MNRIGIFRLQKKWLIILLMLISCVTNAQNKTQFQQNYGVSIYSAHFWRGVILGDAPTIEPEISIEKGNVSFEIWGASTLNNSYNEIDFIFSYSPIPSLAITLYDYYNPIVDAENQFLNFRYPNLRHSLDLVSEFSNENIPFELLGSVFLYGDRDSITGKEMYSCYLEPRYKFILNDKQIKLFAGFTPFKSYYAKNAAFINTGISISETFEISTRFEMPIEFTFFVNPLNKNAFFVVSAGLNTR